MASIQYDPPQDMNGPNLTVDLRHFLIIGLHNRQNIRLDFNDGYTIFIADNGVGKTTALNMLQACLRQEWSKVSKFDFESIEIGFSNGSVFRFRRQVLVDRPFLKRLNRILRDSNLGERDIHELSHLAKRLSISELRGHPLFMNLARQSHFPSMKLIDYLRTVPSFDDDLFDHDSSELSEFRAFLSKFYDHEVLYLPTYRRIEQEYSQLVERGDDARETTFASSINFGMRDVQKRIEEVGKSVRDHLAVTYASINGQMLHQLISPAGLTDHMRWNLQNVSGIEAVLSRLEKFISKEDRDEIVEKAVSGQLMSSLHLSFFLSNLIDSYNEISGTERRLNLFAEACNKYLREKLFLYNPSSASLRLHEMETGDEMSLGVLSSGEKQLIGVLSQVYLSKSKSNIVIFDEPELSLSVEWQRMLLPDIVASERCLNLIACTHSPFVFENWLDRYARSLVSERYVEEEF